jgi:hypothetical protein
MSTPHYICYDEECKPSSIESYYRLAYVFKINPGNADILTL